MKKSLINFRSWRSILSQGGVLKRPTYRCSILSAGGSGSVLISSLIRNLICDFGRVSVSNHNIISGNANDCLHHLACQLQSELNATSVFISPIKFNEACLIIRMGQYISAIVFGFNWYGYSSEVAYVSHEPPDIELLETMDRSSHKFIHTRRDPLDILLSTTKKNEMLGFKSALDENFEFKVLKFAQKLQSFNIKELSGVLVDYDELIQSPVDVIVELGKKINLKISEKDAEFIWDQIAFRQLANAPPGHFSGGGSKKYLSHINPQIMDILKKHFLECLVDPCLSNHEKYKHIMNVNTAGLRKMFVKISKDRFTDNVSILKTIEREYSCFNIKNSIDVLKFDGIRVAANNIKIAEKIMANMIKSDHYKHYESLRNCSVLN